MRYCFSEKESAFFSYWTSSTVKKLNSTSMENLCKYCTNHLNCDIPNICVFRILKHTERSKFTLFLFIYSCSQTKWNNALPVESQQRSLMRTSVVAPQQGIHKYISIETAQKIRIEVDEIYAAIKNVMRIQNSCQIPSFAEVVSLIYGNIPATWMDL